MVERTLKLGELVLTPDERRIKSAWDELGALDQTLETERGNRLRLSLRRERLHRLGGDGRAHKPVSRFAEEGLAGRCPLLEPCRDVDGIPSGERVALARDHLARVNADAALDPHTPVAFELVVEPSE